MTSQRQVTNRGGAFWNQMYAHDGYLYGKDPNAFFKEQLDQLSPGRLLLSAEGEGRNGVYAAIKGWTVDAFDFSEVAKEKAEALALESGVALNYRIADFASPGLAPDSYSVAALIYSHVPPQDRAKGLRAIKNSIRPGGVVIIEAFSPKHLELGSMFGPKSEDLLYTAKELKEVFGDFDIQALRDECIALKEGRHEGEGTVVRMVAARRE
jgi:SAM-dependent methyltransferase